MRQQCGAHPMGGAGVTGALSDRAPGCCAIVLSLSMPRGGRSCCRGPVTMGIPGHPGSPERHTLEGGCLSGGHDVPQQVGPRVTGSHPLSSPRRRGRRVQPGSQIFLSQPQLQILLPPQRSRGSRGTVGMSAISVSTTRWHGALTQPGAVLSPTPHFLSPSLSQCTFHGHPLGCPDVA